MQNIAGEALTAADRLMAFTTKAIALCREHNASVTSWYRTATHNQAVGGLSNSLHLEGLAADLHCDDPRAAAALVTAAHERGLDAVDEGSHVHIELDYRHPHTEA